ncbi:MAG: hypothetical protein QMC89_04065 [Candidatus Hodarchaeaceae archaeon]|nr:hypothetical protein [Candidatus Hodarchaeaceae archaeon]
MGGRMVTAGKIFRLREEMGLKAIAARLKDLREEEAHPVEGGEVGLLTEVSDLSLSAEDLKGIFSQDKVIEIYQRGKFVQQVKTRETPFLFSSYRGHVLLTILERKFQANNIANQLSKALFITSGQIAEAKISPETLKAFHEGNPEDTKVIFFDEVDMPNINKLSLYGSGLIDTSLYNEYCSRGKIWYMVFKSKKYGYIVGVTRNAIVTIFNNVSRDEFTSYVKSEVFPLLSL